MTKRLRVYPSSAAFMWGTAVWTEYSSGCLRRILLDANGVQEPFNPIHSERGAFNEEQYEKSIEVPYECEVPFREEIPSTSCQLSGRIDVVLDKGHPFPVELKSTESENQRKQRIQYGRWGVNNLAQLTLYMVVLGADEGQLQYDFYKRSEDGSLYQPREFTTKRGTLYRTSRTYEVSLSETKYISMDGKETKFTAWDALQHSYWAAQVIERDLVWERPMNYDAPFGSPCQYCPFKTTCNLYDNGLVSGADEFIAHARRELKTYE